MVFVWAFPPLFCYPAQAELKGKLVFVMLIEFWMRREAIAYLKKLSTASRPAKTQKDDLKDWTRFQTHRQLQQQQRERMTGLIVGSFDILVRRVHKRTSHRKNKSRRWWKNEKKRSPNCFLMFSEIPFNDCARLLCSLNHQQSSDSKLLRFMTVEDDWIPTRLSLRLNNLLKPTEFISCTFTIIFHR